MAVPQTVRAIARRLRISEGSRRAALLRMLVAAVILASADVWRAPLLAPSPDVAAVLRIVVIAAAVATLIGAFTRASALALAASAGVLLGMIQGQGTPIHVHHLAWLAVIVAFGRGGDAWSVDAALRVRRGAPSSPPLLAHDATTRWACIVLGLVYFFPGLHKLIDAGSPFTHGDALARLVRLKAIEAGVADAAVPFHLDGAPALLVAGGALIVAAELAVLVAAVLAPRAGFVFVVVIHLVITVLLRMPYTALSVLAPVFLLASPGRATPRVLLTKPLVFAAVPLVAGIVFAGIRGDLAGYPFACYPTFSLPVPAGVRAVDVAAGGVVLPHDVVIPDDMRTPVTFAARRIDSAASAARFVRWRMADPRFARAVAHVDTVDVIVSWRDLDRAGAPSSDVGRFAVPLAPASHDSAPQL